jgi:NitT/TauT family transport system permease protein
LFSGKVGPFLRTQVFILPAPTDIWAAIVKYWSPIWKNSVQTLFTTVLGFLMAVVGGLAARPCHRLEPGHLCRSLPDHDRLQFYPEGRRRADPGDLVRHRYHSGRPHRVPDRILSDRGERGDGLATIEPEMEDVLRALGAKKLDIMLKVGIPRSMPYFFGSLKVAITLAFVGSVISETSPPIPASDT